MSSNSTNINHLTNVIKPRNKNLGLNLSESQSKIAAPSNLKSEFVIIPSTSAPNFGSYFIIDIRERNVIISDILLNFNISAITGRSGDATSYPHFVPAHFFTSKFELVIKM